MEVSDTHRVWGEAIRKRRVAVGFTQTKLGELVGVHQPAVSRWEKGEDCPRDAMKFRLAGALGCLVTDLFEYPAARPPFPEDVAS